MPTWPSLATVVVFCRILLEMNALRRGSLLVAGVPGGRRPPKSCVHTQHR
jgi:hypothetical protein